VFGYWSKRDGEVTNPVDPETVRRFVGVSRAPVS
jgi:predicted TIM-barrel enzyme